jgi:hypothetical protein
MIAMNRPRTVLGVLAFLCLGACGSEREKIDATVVTAIPKDVLRCTRLGTVATDSRELSPTDGLDQLRADAVRQGGNAVLVSSYATSTTSYAYACNPPLKPDSRNAHQTG